MSLSTSRVAAGTASVTLATLPAGPCTLTVVNGGSVTAWLAFGSNPASTNNGVPIAAGSQVAVNTYPGNPSSGVQVICPSGTNTALGYILSTASGGTGL